jgi:signal transduction histidine kinase
MVSWSLTVRVIVFLVLAQVPAFFAAWCASMLLEVGKGDTIQQALDELAIVRTTRLVLESVARDADGKLRLEPTPELQKEASLRPDFLYAAFDLHSAAPLEGSSPQLIAALSGLIHARPAHMHFAVPEMSSSRYDGHLVLRETPVGNLQIAIFKPTFRWDDVWYSVEKDLQFLGAYPAGTIVFTTVVAWFAVRRGLLPLITVTREVRRIDLNSLHQRVSSEHVPTEIKPLVDAVNVALRRLDGNVMSLRRYTANAAHELRTPLAILRARIENADDSSLRSNLLRDTSRMQTIVEQMLIAARLSDNHALFDQKIDLVDTVREVVAGYFDLAIECDRMIEFEADISSTFVRGNKRAIECVVANLIDNALRAEPENGCVNVCIRGDATIIVEDHGPGIEECERSIIFEPFWRKSETSPGTGLGLAITKELIDKLGGRIWVEHTDGSGATFNVTLALWK